jgi:predicted short-subunit dehydrogenase-like oxidoreductase (DUF2520 family)
VILAARVFCVQNTWSLRPGGSRFCRMIYSTAILPAMARKPQVAIVGPGRLGTALLTALEHARYRVREVVSRGGSSTLPVAGEAGKAGRTQVGRSRTTRLGAQLVWFCVPDREIARAARELAAAAEWEGKMAFHASGALPSDELDVLRQRGAAVAAVHPLMTFVSAAIPSLRNVPFAIEGDKKAVRAARQIVKDLGGKAFSLRKGDKAAYHAWGAFTSPLLIALLVAAERVAGAAGLAAKDAREKMMPILFRTLTNYAALGPARSFSGPMARGDVAIVRSHLQALQKVPEAREAYLALARVALRHLPVRHQKQLEQTLKSR